MSDPEQDILDAIEQGSFKYAQSLISIRLKKYPHNTYYGVLNNFLHFSMGKVTESVDQCVKLMETVPNDPKSLGLLYTIFQRVGRVKEMSLVYENAVRKYPNNTIIVSWFENSVKNFDYRALQKSTMSLQKNNKCNRMYSMWASLTCLVLSKSSNDPKEKSLFNNLGLKLIQNLQPLTNTQEVFIYVNLLYHLQNYSEIVSFLHDYKSKQVLDLELKLIYLDVLDIVEDWNELHKYSCSLIFDEKFNDFDTWKYFIRSAYNLGTPFDQVRSKIESHARSRNSALALVALAKVYQESMYSYVIEYYKQFNKKSCGFNDLKYYCESFDTSEFCKFIDEDTSRLMNSSNTGMNELISLINNQKFKLLFTEVGIEFYELNWEIYGRFKYVLKDKEPTDFYPAHELILINVIQDLKENFSITSILKNICILEKISVHDKSNFNLKLWLMKLYSYLNCHSLVSLHYQKLSIKMIQHDTLSHYLISRNCSPSKVSLNYLINIYRFYLTAEYEVNENILVGFDKQVFNKLENFLNFGNKMNKSLSRFNLILEILKVARLTNDVNYSNYFSNHLRNYERSLLNETFEMSDNRDLKMHWKFGINQPLDDSLLSLGKQYGEEYVRLNYVKELIVININNSTSIKLFKLFNKYMNNPLYLNQLTDFEKWIFKIYLSIFKLVKFDNPKENESIEKFLIKNLKSDKINSFINNMEILSWEVNHIIVSLIDLTKIINQLVKAGSSNKLNTINNTLVNYLKSLDIRNEQMKKLNELKTTNFQFNSTLDLDETFVDDTFQIIEKSITILRMLP